MAHALRLRGAAAPSASRAVSGGRRGRLQRVRGAGSRRGVLLAQASGASGTSAPGGGSGPTPQVGVGRTARAVAVGLEMASTSADDLLPRMSIQAISAPVREDLRLLDEALRTCVGERHPMLHAAADQIFGAGGKKLRPTMVFLVARATASLMGLEDLNGKHRRIAEVTEMLHTASLVHDDVLDDCDLRRGKSTVHSLYGTRVAVLAGDFLFAQASWYLANLENLEVIKLISQVIADFANGEISQASSLFDTDVTLEAYEEKSFFKTASLIAASCRSAAVFSGCDDTVKTDMFEYGRHLGLAFQIVDDILDFTQTEEQLGKPKGQDLSGGNLTCPVIFAMEQSDELRDLIDSEFQDHGALERALALVDETGGLDKARAYAKREGDAALACLTSLPPGEEKRSLEALVDYVLERLY